MRQNLAQNNVWNKKIEKLWSESALINQFQVKKTLDSFITSAQIKKPKPVSRIELFDPQTCQTNVQKKCISSAKVKKALKNRRVTKKIKIKKRLNRPISGKNAWTSPLFLAPNWNKRKSVQIFPIHFY